MSDPDSVFKMRSDLVFKIWCNPDLVSKFGRIRIRFALKGLKSLIIEISIILTFMSKVRGLRRISLDKNLVGSGSTLFFEGQIWILLED